MAHLEKVSNIWISGINPNVQRWAIHCDRALGDSDCVSIGFEGPHCQHNGGEEG